MSWLVKESQAIKSSKTVLHMSRPSDQLRLFRHEPAEALHPAYTKFGFAGRVEWIHPATRLEKIIHFTGLACYKFKLM